MYQDKYSEILTKKLTKLKKKDQKQFLTVFNKINQIISNPQHRQKQLKGKQKSLVRVHIGAFVLTYSINHKEKLISFEDYDHHDKIYIN